MYLEDKERKIPPIKWIAFVTMSTEDFKDMIEAAKFDDSALGVVFEVTKDRKIFIKGEGENNQKKAQASILDFTDVKVKLEEEIDIVSKYNRDYLTKVTGACNICNLITFKLRTEYPIQFDLKIPDKMSVSFVLAPLVKND